MGKFTISLDFELGWGALETGFWKTREQSGVYERLRKSIASLTTLLDDLEVPLTWATVGAMISNPAPKDFDYLPEPFSTKAKDFLKTAKVSSYDGRDLLHQILSMKTKQDIGSHSFSHTRFQVKDFSDEAKKIDMQKAVTALKSFDIVPRSFVFPVNQVASLDIVEQSGISVARMPAEMARTKIGKLVERVTGDLPSALRSAHSENFFTESGTMLYHWKNNKNLRLRRQLVNHQSKLALRKAEMSDYHFHIWLHPFNLAEIRYLQNDLSSLIVKAATLRDQGKLEIVPIYSQ